jgi:UDP-glucose 4-epimerase
VLLTGGDLRDETAAFEAVRGCNAIVHAGAITHDDGGTAADIVATNLLGTWHVLLAAEWHAVSRKVAPRECCGRARWSHSPTRRAGR